MKHTPIVSVSGPPPRGFEWTYDDEAAGAAPVHSGELAPGPTELNHRIVVTDTDAASGKHSLMLVEGKNEERNFFPFLHYPIGADAGPIRASLRLKMPSATPSAMYLEFRDYANAGVKYFQTGPHLEIDAQGVLTATPNAGVKLKLPRGAWVLLDMAFNMGKGAAKTFDLTVTVPGQPPQVFRDVPYTDTAFLQAGEIYIVSTGPDGGAFLIDDVRVTTAHGDE